VRNPWLPILSNAYILYEDIYRAGGSKKTFDFLIWRAPPAICQSAKAAVEKLRVIDPHSVTKEAAPAMVPR